MSGLGSFIQSAFQGYTYGQNLQDRRRRRDREDTVWAQQDQLFEWQQEDREFARAERDRAAAAAARERSIFADAAEAARLGYQQEQAGMIDATGDPSRPRPRPENAIGTPPQTEVESPRAPDDAAPGLAYAPHQISPDYYDPRRGADPTGASRPSMENAANLAAMNQPALPGPDRPAMPAPAPRPIAAAMDQAPMPRRGLDVARYQQRPPQPTGLARQARSLAMGMAGQNPAAGSASAMRADLPPRAPVQDAPPRQIAGLQQPRSIAPDSAPLLTPDPQRAAAPRPARAGAAQAAPVIDVEGKSTSDLDAQARSAPPEAGGSPSVAVAKEAIAASTERGVIGPNDRPSLSDAQQRQAKRSFMDHYLSEGVPKIVEHYLSTGQIEKAQAFEKWAQSKEVEGQLQSWSQAVLAATLGDEDGFLTSLADTYNQVNDGYEIVRDRSGFLRDAKGNVTGAELSFKGEDGKVFTRRYENMDDVIEAGIYAFSPEQTFEYLWGLSQQARQMRINRTKSALPSQGDIQAEIRREALEIRKAQQFASDPLSEEDIQRMAAENVMRQLQNAGSIVSGGLSVGGNGAGPKPPDWTGR
ncbi:hypothetical protein DSD19_04520 [Rhodovulum sp. BSW8]|uniref:hypothetical protein n=1 Tax=Rhodovulum sp. BSW8 TaxID=2259645 RepID=UPI000DE29C1C|nr:hypothetical protein [Rhodovulum sp. BSW8]RBO54646.1 hypothetical protein DSD19_04520 [Rhodovulum sp. BSW8]